MTSADRAIDELIDIGRSRALTEKESALLERLLKRQRLANGQGAWVRNGWKADDRKLRAMVRAGKRPAQIGMALKRTAAAVRRRMRKLGLHVQADWSGRKQWLERRQGSSAQQAAAE